MDSCYSPLTTLLLSAVALKRVYPALSQPESLQKKQPFCHVHVPAANVSNGLFVLFLCLFIFLFIRCVFVSGDGLFQSCGSASLVRLVLSSEAVLLWAQRAEGSSVCPWPRASQRRESHLCV